MDTQGLGILRTETVWLGKDNKENRWLTVLELDKTQKRVLIENNVNEDEVATDNVNKVELNEGIQDTDAV